jgi:hypothetical protein
VLLLRRLAAGTSATAGGPNEPCLGTLEPPRLCLVRLVVAVKDAPWDAIRELLLALQIVDAATDSCVQFEYLVRASGPCGRRWPARRRRAPASHWGRKLARTPR